MPQEECEKIRSWGGRPAPAFLPKETDMQKALWLALALIALAPPALAQARVTRIEAKLFYNERKGADGTDVAGTLSRNVIDDPSVTLWNTFIGEGFAEGYTNQTAVIVTVASRGKVNKGQTLRLTAAAGNKVILNQRLPFSVLQDPSICQLLFLLNGTGGEPITLRATVMEGSRAGSTLIKTINFMGGE
jgi:hypothetical protein